MNCCVMNFIRDVRKPNYDALLAALSVKFPAGVTPVRGLNANICGLEEISRVRKSVEGCGMDPCCSSILVRVLY